MRPIDADELEEFLRDNAIYAGTNRGRQDAFIDTLQFVRHMHTTDEDYVVRCIRCAHCHEHDQQHICLITGKVVLPNFYCNFGTKK